MIAQDARALYVVDVTAGRILWDRDAHRPLPPASMSKLMTLTLAGEALRAGRIDARTPVTISDHAASRGGATLALQPGEQIPFIDLMHGAGVLSANDAATALAETLSPDGTEAGFARAMTIRAAELGLTRSAFDNASGLPSPGQMMSMRDLVALAHHLRRSDPATARLCAKPSYTFDGRALAHTRNRNPLLQDVAGADGMKTGFTRASGHGLTGSVTRDGREILFAMTGLRTESARRDTARALVDWAFARPNTPAPDHEAWRDDAPPPADLSTLTPTPYLQVGVFGVEQNARNSARRLGEAGLETTVNNRGSAGKPLWSVTVGPLLTRTGLADALNLVNSGGFTDAYPVAYPD
ncbi:D-alanyl-D-alanine carboxypeptidase [Pseudaestuariivita atlantica]|uniref:D-alanyl-D-alanine carboxypeptidase n=1 Tax=Pseudaestuariivita atlantica TaxID=1317121 RepID=UPI00067C2543|nr:D-alanyl-D-alanine carboxypeptidase [Pseudaestuariivita atlantica]